MFHGYILKLWGLARSMSTDTLNKNNMALVGVEKDEFGVNCDELLYDGLYKNRFG